MYSDESDQILRYDLSFSNSAFIKMEETWDSVWCGTGVNVVLLKDDAIPYLLVQREVNLIRCKDQIREGCTAQGPDDCEGHLGDVHKWSTTGGGVQTEAFQLDQPSDEDTVLRWVPELIFRKAAKREAFEETRGVVALELEDLIHTRLHKIPHRVCFPREYQILRVYLAILGAEKYQEVLTAIQDNRISGATEPKPSIIDNHLLIPLSTIVNCGERAADLSDSELLPEELKDAGLTSESDQTKWRKFIERHCPMEQYREIIRLARVACEDHPGVTDGASRYDSIREGFVEFIAQRDAAGESTARPPHSVGAAAGGGGGRGAAAEAAAVTTPETSAGHPPAPPALFHSSRIAGTPPPIQARRF